METKTLMFYINAIHDGGAERVMLQLAKRFAGAGYRSVLVTSFVDSREYPVPEGVERISIEQEQTEQSRLKRNLSRIKALRKLIKEHRPRAVISFMAEPNFRAVLSSAFLPVKVIVSVRNDPERSTPADWAVWWESCCCPWPTAACSRRSRPGAGFPRGCKGNPKS